MNILLLNAGSSSLKASLVESEGPEALAVGSADWAGETTRYSYGQSDSTTRREEAAWKGHARAVQQFLADLMHVEPVVLAAPSALAAVGHRIVHGGHFTSAIRITPQVRSRINALAELAPLHNPASLEALDAADLELPDVPQIAVFDTMFHSTLPAHARTYPIPEKWSSEWNIRRFGFHGLSHAYCSRRAAEMLRRPIEELRLIVCHLGHGCSASAVQGGRCVDTTMGFTPLEGLMMATRCGSIDPSIVIHLVQHRGLSIHEVDVALNRQSGLLGVSRLSGDMREVLSASKQGDVNSQLALEIYCHRVRQAIGALAVTMGGVDALVFTAGVGEHSSEVREVICEGLECLGLRLDPEANRACETEADVATRNAPGRILVIATREDLSMLREVVGVLEQEIVASA